MSIDDPRDLGAAMRRHLDGELSAAATGKACASPVAAPAHAPAPSAAGTAPQRFLQEIADIASTVLKIPPDRLDVRLNMARYGVDSIIVTEIMKRVSDLLDLPIAPTVFFEARHLEELAGILHQRYRESVERRYAKTADAAPTATSAAPTATPAAPAAPVAAPQEIAPEVRSWIARYEMLAAKGVGAIPVEAQPDSQARPSARGGGMQAFEPVAIVAMEGIFPESANLQEFERHLRQGDDCIREVPAGRWDWRQVYGNPKEGEYTRVKYGGFAPDIDKFDPVFFGMSPREAELVDPQHRLFMQCVWKLVESAGYAPGSLAGRKVGLFIGINLLDYANLVDRHGAMEALHMTSLGHMFCPNRLSFLLDIHGPSQVIDTACSSSLVALHRAILAVQHEGCEMAIAGGANLLISPDLHIMYSKVGMICEDGRCKTFSRDANGYVRSDGVGAVLVKTLRRAEQDRDNILAVIRGSAENHGGLSTSLTAPNPKAQASLIVEAHRKAGIDPRSVGYIECHGTGTALGDPIEINGLKMAFTLLQEDSGLAGPDAAYCGLGSVKSNIGHAETAAGIAGVIKAVLSLRHRRLYASLHCDDLNPMIELERSPFYILKQGRHWERPVIAGREQPRRAGVSSFGAGGSNAHVVIEEYIVPRRQAPRSPVATLVVLSARNEERLREVVDNLLRFLADTPDAELPALADIAYTLQVGREPMAARLALVADSVEALRERLGRIALAEAGEAGVYRGSIGRGRSAGRAEGDGEGMAQRVRECFTQGRVAELAELWTRGMPVDWDALYAGIADRETAPRRVALPTYPFARQRYWLPEPDEHRNNRREGVAGAGRPLHPLAQRNTSDLQDQRYSSRFSGREPFLADHVVMGERVLPGVAYLEMARAAMVLASPGAGRETSAFKLRKVVWARPFAVGEAPVELHVTLQPGESGQVAFRIYSTPAGPEGERVLHAQGIASMATAGAATGPSADHIDVVALREAITAGRPGEHRLDAAQCYDAYRAMGIDYGPSHRCLETVYHSPARPDAQATSAGAVGAPQVLARLVPPESAERDTSPLVLPPGLMDAALQACIGLLPASGIALPTAATADAMATATSLPFALDELAIVSTPAAARWAWIRHAEGNVPDGRLRKLDIDLLDEQGSVCVRLRGFSSRTPEPAAKADTGETLLCTPAWEDRAAADEAQGAPWPVHQVVVCDTDGHFPESVEREIAQAIPGATCTRLRLAGAIESGYEEAAVAIFGILKDAIARKDAGRCLVQVLVPADGQGALLGGLAGLLKTANRESARVRAQLIAADGSVSASELAASLAADSRSPGDEQVRYRERSRQVLRWREMEMAAPPTVLPWKDNGVYLITGGAGGLGLLFARVIAAHARRATVVLCGRSGSAAPRKAALDALAHAGLAVDYRRMDLGSQEDVQTVIAGVLRDHGRLDAILHCAGVLRDNYIHRKSAHEIAEVLAAKVAGTMHLDRATRDIDLDFVALFSSVAGAWGSAGQADYAAANAFLDAYAHYRNDLVARRERRGRAVSIDWPLWANGGMRMEAAAHAMMKEATGMVALPDAEGVRAFHAILASGVGQAMVMHGQAARLRRALAKTERPVPVAGAAAEQARDAAPVADANALRARIRQALMQAVAAMMKFDLDDLDIDADLGDYGFDSITFTEFANRLNGQYRLELTPTVFFEYPTIAGLAAWLAEEHAAAFSQVSGLQPRAREAASASDAGAKARWNEEPPVPAPAIAMPEAPARAASPKQAREAGTAIAVVGMSGCFPMAKDLDAFWDNLVAGRDCIGELPAERRDWWLASDAAGAAFPRGGFIDAIGHFDARFFGISPREAALMDPQQRLLMQYAWKAIEDAGYAPASLAGSNTGIFLGTAASGYGELMARGGAAIESYSSTGAVGSIGPNRMSYFLDLHGPSEPVETACSSSLVAIHRALAAMANGDCDQAIVGGINLIVSPETQASFEKAGMLCPDGRCKTFSRHANGYVRGEGVGMLFLKRLEAAETAGDHIYGVICGSAENHGGRANSLTAPNPNAQAELLKAAYARAGVDPRTVGYIEAHGTGTALGDPIEISGLKTAFRDLYRSTGEAHVAQAHCGLGSVKTNIGHLELAAGIAGVIKVLLQLRHRTLVRSLHCEEVNPYIRLEDSPFYLVRENREWEPPRDRDGREAPRRAGVSSFGFGGVNAHIVIEEYLPRAVVDEASQGEDGEPASLVVLSAKNAERLQASARQLLGFLAGDDSGADAGNEAAQRALAQRLCTLAAEILQVDAGEIGPAQALDEYGFERMHRTRLHSRLQEALSMELGARAFLDQHCLAAIAAAVLEANPALRERLSSEKAPAAPGREARHLVRLADLAYTLQVGREPMDERLAIIATSTGDLEDKLRAFVEGRAQSVPGVHLGQAKPHKGLLSSFSADAEMQEALQKWIARGKFDRLLEFWVKGLDVDWEKLYGESGPCGPRPRRISAPGYPFAEQHYWFEPRKLAAPAGAAAPSVLHPLVHQNVSTLRQAAFTTRLDGTEFFLADHRMRGQRVLPGVAYLEMVRAAAAIALGDAAQPGAILRLRDVVWIRPAVVESPREFRIALAPAANGAVRVEISSRAATDASAEPEAQVHGQASASFQTMPAPPALDCAALLAQPGMTRFDARRCYALFSAAGLDYGPAHQAIAELHAGGGQVLARLVLPEALVATRERHVLHPSLMDAALQAAIGLTLAAAGEEKGGSAPGLALPFALESVDVFGSCEATMWAWVRERAGAPPGSRLRKLDIDVCDDSGQVRVRLRGFSSRLLDATVTEGVPAAKRLPAPPAATDPTELEARAISYFKRLLCATLQLPIEEIDADEALDSYGIDSMMVMELTTALEKPFGELSKTLFFEYRTLSELVRHFVEAHRSRLLEVLDFERGDDAPRVEPRAAPAATRPARIEPALYPAPRPAPVTPSRPEAGPLDIAVIGLSGRYPQSRDIEEFWRNLRDGRDCITEVPAERWDWREHYSEDRGELGRHYCKWGGFIADVDKFDPLFFSISPGAAEYMDPQERLFLEHAWMAMEDAGYRREDLQVPAGGASGADDLPAQVGVYAGVMYGEYQLLALQARLGGRETTLANFYASIANRVSYALNLHGPSMSVDTMCSSSLTALHLACLDLKLGRTDLAFAGGVNLSIHPNKYDVLSLGQFISSRGKCESFGAGGDGYVPGEGVGVVLLKRLADAERDGDHIYGVIKASALNHGGKTNGYSVPNPHAQHRVIERALREAKVDPRAIGYVEAHGTGTRLGDPIEIAGLAKALAHYAEPDRPLWIGSAKSNIGHGEAAAGIAGLTKVLLQMREGSIAPSLHSQTPNPNIDFAATPFQVNQYLRAWERPVIDGATHLRVAGISSFGAGGANAHLLVEEYPAPARASEPLRADEACVFVLSAKTEAQLADCAANLLRFVREREADARDVSLRDVAYTLQVGREAMPQRLGFTAASVAELAGKLERYLQGEREGLHAARASTVGGAEVLAASGDKALAELLALRHHDDVLARWVRGAGVDWQALFADEERPPLRVSLPTYPFARERYWIHPEPPRAPDRVRSATVSLSEAVAAPEEAIAADLLTLRPAWKATEARPAAELVDFAEHRVLFAGRVRESEGATCLPLQPAGETIDDAFTELAVQVFAQVREILERRMTGRVLLQVVVESGAPAATCPPLLLGALAAMLKTAQRENPRLVGQVIDLDERTATLPPEAIAQLLRMEGQCPGEPQVRYRDGSRQVLAWEEAGDEARPTAPVWRQGGTYLITGGAGGLGLVFAREILREVPDATLVLVGRSPLDETRRASLESLRATGARVDYREVDVADAQAVHELVRSLEREGRQSGRRPLDGIVHAAGVIRDNFILRKDASELRSVLAAKVSGVVNLDRATRGLDLDFMVLFASVAGVAGNPGQCDYATANAFLDAYAAWRNALVSGEAADATGAPVPRGRTLSIDWPLWEEGGMDIAAASKELMWRATGLKPLRTASGVDAFHRGLASGLDQVMVLQGDVARLRALFVMPGEAAATPGVEPGTSARDGGEATVPPLAGSVEKLLATMLSEMLKVPSHRIEADVPLEQYGVDSVAMMKLVADLEKIVGELPKTLFFEYPSIALAAAYLAEHFAGPLAARLAPDPVPTREKNAAPAARLEITAPTAREAKPPVTLAARAPVADAAPAGSATATPASSADPRLADIAIVGMAGRFPGARDVDEFWRNLAEGRDSITEVPPERWDHSRYFDPDKGAAGKTSCKWGGFLDEVDRFDSRFFRIAASEAELLDPQERLFLETAWNLLESSGYLGETLQRLAQSRVGVFVGSMTQQYHAFESDLVRESLVVLSSPSSIANRVSYFFNFRGPSLAVDTMCSSSLVALHMACDSLRRGDCRLAIAGGVNLTIHPKKYIGLSATQMIGSHADSTSFGDGDGYLPAEGVGAVLLKPLREAIADGDDILAVIKSTAINHGGQSSGYRVPSATAQAELIAENLARSGIDPRTVSYVESAANGSPLGDAIELAALTAGFRQFTAERQFCAIGAVKSNIGHAEAASGMSQLIKVIQQLRHRQLAPTIKARPLNPKIAFDDTPFYLQRELSDWPRPRRALDGGEAREFPRRATISALGAGGSNAHMIVEEYDAGTRPLVALRRESGAQLIVLSAKTAPQLDAVVERLLRFVEATPDVSMESLAYTLQAAREVMDHRLALVVEGREQLVQALSARLRKVSRDEFPVPMWAGNSEEDTAEVRQSMSGRTGLAMLQVLFTERDLAKLGYYWAKGVRFSWQPLHGDAPPRRIALPTYPFERGSHWLAGDEAATLSAQVHFADGHLPLRERVEAFLAHGTGELAGIPAGEIRMAKSLQDYGIDSVSSLRLRRGVEESFGVRLSARDLATHATLGALAALIAERHVERASSEDGSAAEAAHTGTRDDRQESLSPSSTESPLSEGQKGLWLLQQVDPGTSAYNVPMALRFGARLDAGLFRQACERMLRRYPVLESTFGSRDGEPYRASHGTAPLAFENEDVDDLNESGVIDRLRTKAKEPFDLVRGPLFRVHVLSDRAGEASHVLVCVHHIVFDGASAVLLVRDLLATYRDLAAGREPALPPVRADYDDFVRWQRDFMAGGQAAAQAAYWQSQLGGDLPTLALPTDFPRPATPGHGGASLEATIEGRLAERLRALANSLQVNPSVLFLGAFTLLLRRYSGDDDIVVGMPTLGRPEGRFDDAVGYFVNMIAVRCRLSGGQAVERFLRDLQLTVADAMDNADYPFPAVLKDLRLARDPSRSPVFQVMFAYQNFAQPGEPAGLPVTVLREIGQEGTHDLALEVYPDAGAFRMRLDYRTDLYGEATMRRTMAHFVRLLESVADSPQAAIAAQGLLSLDERRRILVDWRGSAAAGATDEGIVEGLQRQAQRTPSLVAVVAQDRSITYAQLDRESAQLANFLHAQGVGAGDAVGACLSRGLDAIVALLAILKAGAVYVPVPADVPPQRLRHVREDSDMRVMLTQARLRERIEAATASPDMTCIAVDERRSEILAGSAEPGPRVAPAQAAYVIYTSGSTGQPKGVAISHASIAHHCRVIGEAYALESGDRVLQFAEMSVDTALEQVLPVLLRGATVVVRPDTPWSARDFVRNVGEQGITVADLPPSYLHEVLQDAGEDADREALATLRLVIVGGEPLAPETVHLWRESRLRDRRLVNAYGPTETTITSTLFDVDAREPAILGTVPVGRPLPGEQAWILDADGQPVPVGVPGELHIGGSGLAIGYLNQPELTARQFIDNPASPGTRVYRTGDLACWRADGAIVFLGRRDHQVKIRGFRVECGEVEAALQGLAGVRQAVACVRPVNGQAQLVAFVVRADGVAGAANDELRQALATRLPGYMVPAAILSLAQLPLTAGGKVDRGALGRMALDLAAGDGRVAPQTPLERQLADLWRQVLGVADIGVHDNFFDLGGHSLLAVRLASAIRRETGRELSLSSLFEAPDIARQTRLLEAGERQWSPLVCLQTAGELPPWFCVHAAAGNVLCYRELSRCLGGERPVYAFQAPDADDGAHPGTVEGLAALYVRAMRVVQAKGPYHLGGWSMGGVVAFEMARQLQAAGERVESLVLIDSWTPEAVRALEDEWLRRNPMPGDGAEALLRHAFDREPGMDAADVDPAQREQLFRAFRANVQAMRRYAPQPYRGSARLFSAGADDAAAGATPAHGWAKWIEAEFIAETVPGDHYSLLEQPNVAVLAARVAECLRDESR